MQSDRASYKARSRVGANGAPPEVTEYFRKWLESLAPLKFQAAADLKRRIHALANDDRMRDVWRAVADWPGNHAMTVAELVIELMMPFILVDLKEPPGRRIAYAGPAFSLAITAEALVEAIDEDRTTARELWEADQSAGSIDALRIQLKAFAERSHALALERHAELDFMPAISRRGRGDLTERAYSIALQKSLETLTEQKPAAIERVVATITDVVFARNVQTEPDTLRRRRQRECRR
jgi:hypothetical protein